MRRHPGVLTAGVTLIAGVLLASCSSDTPAENTEQACAHAEELSAALASLNETLTGDGTVDDVKSARSEVATAYDALDGALDDVAQDRLDAVEDAWDRLDDAVEQVDGDATLSQAADSLRDDVAAVQDARESLVTELGC